MGTATAEKAIPKYDGRKFTREQYLDLEEDGFKYDMERGVLRVSPSGDFWHGKAQAEMTSRMATSARKSGKGHVATEVDVLLPDGGDVVRPDISFILNEHMDRVLKHIHGAPDIAVEVLSEKTRSKDLGAKAERYLANGVQEYWILDPRGKTIQVWNNRGDLWEKRAGDSLSSELLDGFVVQAGDVFPESK